MPHYAVGLITVTDPSWVRAYLDEVTGMVERAGGRYLSRTGEVEQWEGDGSAPNTVVLIEWPDAETARAFYESDEYRPHREARQLGALNQFVLVPAGDAFANA